MANRSQLLRQLIAALVLILLIGIVEYWLGWRKLLAPWSSLSFLQIVSAVTLLLVSYTLRAIRIQAFFPTEIKDRRSFVECLRLVLLNTFFNNLLPTRTGEISFPVLMKRYFGIELARALPALLWLRFMDFHTLGLIALIGLISIDTPLRWIGYIAVIPWLTLPLLIRFSGQQISKRFPDLANNKIGSLFTKLLAGLPQEISSLLIIWGWTIANWATKIIAFTWILSLFAQCSLTAALFGSIAGDLTSVLPIHGFAGAGSYEAGVMVGLAPFSIDTETGISAAINLHLFILGNSVFGALAALVSGHFIKGQRKSHG